MEFHYTMSLGKRLLLNCYYYATYPARTWNVRREAARGLLPAIVLYYHRIADDGATPWTMSHAMFARQIGWLKKRFPLVSLEEAQRRIREGCNRRTCVSITFDDGYADNCHEAIPRLVRERIPCTYFVTAENVLEEKPFSHDLALGRRLEPNTVEQVRAMAAAGVEIGSHAFHHTDLGAIADARVLRKEVVASKDALEKALSRKIRYFAFPFGQRVHLNPMVFPLAKAVGYGGVCSAYGGYNFPGDDPFHLQRIPADEWMIHLKNWATLDPRKRNIPRFLYPEEINDPSLKELAQPPAENGAFSFQ
jgi:peptidoglycan/xylan/chitin deacetylase (PgdA/CDA1 family)